MKLAEETRSIHHPIQSNLTTPRIVGRAGQKSEVGCSLATHVDMIPRHDDGCFHRRRCQTVTAISRLGLHGLRAPSMSLTRGTTYLCLIPSMRRDMAGTTSYHVCRELLPSLRSKPPAHKATHGQVRSVGPFHSSGGTCWKKDVVPFRNGPACSRRLAPRCHMFLISPSRGGPEADSID